MRPTGPTCAHCGMVGPALLLVCLLVQNGLQDLLNLMASSAEPDVLLNCAACLVNITRNSQGVSRRLAHLVDQQLRR